MAEVNDVYAGSQNITTIVGCFAVINFKDAYNEYKNREISTEYRGKYVKATIVRKALRKHKIYSVCLENGKKLLVTEDHIHNTDNGDKTTIKLSVGDKLYKYSARNPQWLKVVSVDSVTVQDRHIYSLSVDNFSLPNGLDARGELD